MYFKCPTLQVTQLVERCEGHREEAEGRSRFREKCVKCNDWKVHTSVTIARDIVEAPAHAAAAKIKVQTPEERKRSEGILREFRGYRYGNR